MKRIAAAFLFSAFVFNGFAQVDTLNTAANKLNIAAFKEGKSTYAVFFEDSLGNRVTSADLWDRSIQFGNDAAGRKTFTFRWTVWRKDSLQASVEATGLLPSLQMLTHKADYVRRGKFSYVFENGTVRIPAEYQKTAKDSAFNVTLDPPGFEFPMDLEIFPLVPFKKVGQKLVIAFYEPGTAKASYYNLTVTGKEDLKLPAAQTANCWLLRIDYSPTTYATFWIADKTREVLKMQEYFRGRYRYKVRLY